MHTTDECCVGDAGYIMFGNSVSDEVSLKDACRTVAYPDSSAIQFSVDLMKHNVHPALNTIALWGLVITPL